MSETTNGSTRSVRVLVRPKPAVLDPQGAAVESGLSRLGFDEASDVRVGRVIEFEVPADADEKSLRERIDDVCRRFLSNPIIEDYSVELEGSR